MAWVSLDIFYGINLSFDDVKKIISNVEPVYDEAFFATEYRNEAFDVFETIWRDSGIEVEFGVDPKGYSQEHWFEDIEELGCNIGICITGGTESKVLDLLLNTTVTVSSEHKKAWKNLYAVLKKYGITRRKPSLIYHLHAH